MLNELCRGLVPQKNQRERGLESKVVDVKCAKNLVFITFFKAGGIFHQRGSKTDFFFLIWGFPFPYYDSSEKLHFETQKMPKTQGKLGAQNAKGTKPADHPVVIENRKRADKRQREEQRAREMSR